MLSSRKLNLGLGKKRAHNGLNSRLVGRPGLEPGTNNLKGCCSTIELSTPADKGTQIIFPFRGKASIIYTPVTSLALEAVIDREPVTGTT